jgi:hypothetical protein
MSLALVFSSCNTNEPEVIRLSKGWKFKTGDNTAWAKPDLDDDGWDSINVSTTWESQDNNFYDGYAWYRVKFRLPSSLKGNPFFNDTLQLIIGRVDDTEQTFLNGELIGQNGKNMPAVHDSLPPFESDRNAYSYYRRYVLPVNDPRIKWDDMNLLAIRVNDHGGGGRPLWFNPGGKNA